MTEQSVLTRSWAEVNLDAISANVRRLRRGIRRDCDIMGVVKADAYGHGVARVAPALLAAGANRLAVSMLDEAIELRRSGIDAPILVLGYTDPRRADQILDYQITQTVFSRDLAASLSRAASARGCTCRIHIKVDTGMSRVGFLAGYQAIKEITWIRQLPGIVIEGLYTHFASADEPDETFTRLQFEQFMGICAELGRIGLSIPLKHVCNSAAIMRFPEMHLDMVRPGLLLYGMIPNGCPGAWTDLQPAMTLKSCIVHLKSVPAGSSVSYGRLFVTPRETRIATLPIGYADGYLRVLTGQASVLVHGCRVPVIGRICMDSCMVDLTDLPPPAAAIGDEVILFGPDVKAEAAAQVLSGVAQPSQTGERLLSPLLSVDEVAAWMGTINYEVTCVIGRRMPRAYRSGGQIEAVSNYLLTDGAAPAELG